MLSATGRARRLASPGLLAASLVAVGLHLFGLYRPSGPPTTPWFPQLDKLEHLLGFALPVFCVLLWLTDRARQPGGGAAWVVVAAFALHAPTSELVQARLLPGRTGDLYDLVADLAGVVLGVAAFVLLARRRGST